LINILPMPKVFTIVAIFYALIVAILLWIMSLSASISLERNMQIALSGAFVLNATLLGFIFFGWRKLWAKFPRLNNILFPDLNGKWEMKIHWNGIGPEGVKLDGIKDAEATIKQNFIHLSIEVNSDDSESETLMTKPKKDGESGRPILYYVYRNIPKQRNGDCSTPYDGAAILKLDPNSLTYLRGNYFTGRQTYGFFELTKKAAVTPQ
jgi:hypothetical protein